MNQELEKNSLGLTQQATLWICVGAVFIAALPHFFLDMPISFYQENNLRGWLGLSIWSPAFLASAGLFFGADGSIASKSPLIRQADARLVLSLSAPILVAIYLGAVYFDGYQRVGAWSELGLAMLLYAGIFAIGTLFWQGIFQAHLLGGVKPGGWQRVLVALFVALVGCSLWLPFLVNYEWADVASTLSGLIGVYLGLALVFEFGLSVFGCAALGGLMGVAWAWAHQATFY